jgi:uncharacterized protein (UPF0297 family)
MKAIEVNPPVIDYRILDLANDMLEHSIEYKDLDNAEWWLDKVMTELAKIMVQYGENDIDTLYDWVIDYDDEFCPMHKETFEDELDMYIQDNLQELWKKYLIHTTNE